RRSILASSTFFFFTDPPTPEIYTLSLHDALPISVTLQQFVELGPVALGQRRRLGYVAAGDFEQPYEVVALELLARFLEWREHPLDRKSTRLNSSHVAISYAVFCLKKKKTINYTRE